MKADRNISKIIFYGVSILCLVGIVTCLICDLAINRALTWSLYTVFSIPYFWLLTLPPTLMKRYKVELTLAVFSIGAIPYLALLDTVTPVAGWFMPFGLPVAAASILAIWLTYVIFRFLPANIFYKTALIVVLFGIGMNLVVDFSLASFLSTPVSWLQMIINLLTTAVITGICVFFGYRRTHPKAAQ